MKKRDIAISVVLTIVTCGIYGIYWFICLTDDIKTVAEDKNFQSGAVAFLLTLVTCGLYGLYWAYKMGELLKIAEAKHGLPEKDNAILYLLLEFFGLGIVNYALFQSELNMMIKD